MPDFIGGAGNDALTGTVGDDSLHGLGGDDTLDGGFGVVHAYGGDGDDLIYLDDGPGGRWYVDYDRFFADTPAQAPAPDPSVFDGGAGNDTLMTGRVETGDVLDLAAGALIHLVTLEDGSVATVREFTFSSIENVIVYGGEVIGDDGPNALSGPADAEIYPALGAPSAVTLYGAGGDDTLAGPGALYGGAGDDVVSGAFASIMDGGDGLNTLTFTSSHQAAFVSLASGSVLCGAEPSYASGFEILLGSAQDDQLDGDAHDNRIVGGAGDDSIATGSGADTALGGDGSDIIAAGDGPDMIDGGGGDDLVIAGSGGGSLYGGLGNDTLSFDAAHDIWQLGVGGDFEPRAAPHVDTDLLRLTQTVDDHSVQAGGFENVTGSSGDDLLKGDAGANRLSGAAGDDVIAGREGDDTLMGGDGADLLDGGAGRDTAVFTEAFAQVSLSYANGDILVSTPTGVDTVRSVEHFVFGDGDYDVGDDGRIVAVAAMRLAAGADAATLTGGGGDDTLTGGAFNDQLEGGGRSDVIFGGGGDDTAVYQGFSRDYAINFDGPSGDGQISGGPEGGLDTLAGVEALRFADGTFSFELHGEAAEIYRLYDAFLGRAPDDAGIIAYLDFLKSGHSLADMANAAAQSAEFLSHTAALNDTQFVQYVYETALHRAPDAAGLGEYVTDLQLGLFTRTSLILQAAESPEHVALTAPAIEAHGLWEPDAVNDQILLLYDAAIQREPDAFGLAAYGALLRSGTTAREIANQMASSAEFLAHHAAQNDADFINSLYQAEVGRAADPSGLAAYSGQLAHGFTRGDLLYETAMSLEHQSHILPGVDPLLAATLS